MGRPAVLRLFLISIWTWAPLLSAVLQNKLVHQLPPGFTAKGQEQQHEPEGGPVLQAKLEPTMPPGVGGMILPGGGFVMIPSMNLGRLYDQYPWEMLKFQQLWQSYFQNRLKNDRGAHSPSFSTSGSSHLWNPQERDSQFRSAGARHSQHAPGGTQHRGGCRHCGGVQPSQTSRPNVPFASGQHPSSFQPWSSQYSRPTGQSNIGSNRENVAYSQPSSGSHPGFQSWGYDWQKHSEQNQGDKQLKSPSSSSFSQGQDDNLKFSAGLSNRYQLWGQSGGGANVQIDGQQPKYPEKQIPGNQHVPQEASLEKQSKIPTFPHGYQVFNYRTKQNGGQSTSSPSNARLIDPISSNVYPLKPQVSQPGIGTLIARDHTWNRNHPSVLHQSGYPSQSQHQGSIKPKPPLPFDNHLFNENSYQQQSSQNGQFDRNFFDTSSTLEDMGSPGQSKSTNGYQGLGSINQDQANNAEQQSSHFNGHDYSSRLNKPSNLKQPGSSDQHMPSQWLQIRPPKQAMSSEQSRKPQTEGSAKYYKIPSRLIQWIGPAKLEAYVYKHPHIQPHERT